MPEPEGDDDRHYPRQQAIPRGLVLGFDVDQQRPTLANMPLISAIVLAKLSAGPLVTDDEAERARRLAHVRQALADFGPLPFDAAACAFGQVASSLRRSGRKPDARALDALIAISPVIVSQPRVIPLATPLVSIEIRERLATTLSGAYLPLRRSPS